jgi:hypothetical protein
MKIFRIIWDFSNISNESSDDVWNFGDPATGVNNTSTDLSPFHDFSIDGSILLQP